MNNEYSSDVPPIKMGHKILIKDVTNISHSDIDVIINAVLTYGMCCIKGQKLEPKSLESLTMRFGEKITLPRYMTFDNYVDNYASVLRVSNIKKDGKIIENFTGAEYWHQDGDFNVGNRRRIWSFLYADIVPPAGGNTGFCDARRVLKILPKELLNFVKINQISINPNDIPDFNLNNIEHEKLAIVYHNMVEYIKNLDEYALYMGGINIAHIVGLDITKSEQIKTKIVNYLTREDNCYIHKWEPGDLVIWDNMLVYHRSMGGYANEKRLLYRTQARMFQE